jgi:hypothetical protein
MDIPEYYRKFQSQPAEPPKIEEPEQEKIILQQQKPQAGQEQVKPAAVPQDKTIVFQGNGFTLNQLEDWEDKTIYTITGPVTDGIQHNVVINVERDCPYEKVVDYANWQIKTLEEELKGCSLLKRGETKLTNGTDAYEAVFSWYPVDDFRIYQHQVYIVLKQTAYKLTASFTKKTWKTLGPSVLRMLLSINIKV